MKKYILTIHAWLGLLCLPYLLIFGLSSLNFNHPIHWPEIADHHSKSWDIVIPAGRSMEDTDLAGDLIDSLGVMGWYLPWKSERDTSRFHFEVYQMAKQYRMDYYFADNRLLVDVKNNPPANILGGLHGLSNNVPNAPWWVNTWQYYQDLAVYSFLFWLVSGIWMWSLKKADRTWGILILTVFFIISTGLILYVWLAG